MDIRFHVKNLKQFQLVGDASAPKPAKFQSKSREPDAHGFKNR
jgi:hypothetical protein